MRPPAEHPTPVHPTQRHSHRHKRNLVPNKPPAISLQLRRSISMRLWVHAPYVPARPLLLGVRGHTPHLPKDVIAQVKLAVVSSSPFHAPSDIRSEDPGTSFGF